MKSLVFLLLLGSSIAFSAPKVASKFYWYSTESNLSLKESFVHIENGELYIKNMHVGAYKPARLEGYDPTRNRKLLANRREIEKLASKSDQQGLAIIPLKVYLKDSLIKMEIALAKGKKKWDKREGIKKRDIERDLKRRLV